MKTRQQFRVARDLSLSDKQASEKPLSGEDKEIDKQRVDEMALRIAALQDILYAEHERKLLVILQGMDTSGKDGTVKWVFGRIDPQGIRSVSFRAPTEIERSYDYLWRIHRQVPARGEIVIFNRSHYEDVLVPRVHGRIDADECKRRHGQIRDFERMLAETGTVILKFFLHISKEEQRRRLQSRLDNPDKLWKFDPQDLVERTSWDDYRKAYEEIIPATDAHHAPWYVIPADSKAHRNLAVASILLETMEDMKLRYPPGDRALAGMRVE